MFYLKSYPHNYNFKIIQAPFLTRERASVIKLSDILCNDSQMTYIKLFKSYSISSIMTNVRICIGNVHNSLENEVSFAPLFG